MSRSDDYRDEMLKTTVSDQDIERLLTGAAPAEDGLIELVPFVEMLRDHASAVPSDSEVDRLAAEAGAIVRAAQGPGLVSSDQPPRRITGLRFRPQLAAALIAFLVLSGLTGVAVAADDAAPGDALYGLDRALEKIGIGAGQAEERLNESSELAARGRTKEALDHAAKAFDDAQESGEDVSDLEETKAALEASAEKLLSVEASGESAQLVQENVAALLEYIKENIGKGVGVDGEDFGQGVADLARRISNGSAELKETAEANEVVEPEEPEEVTGSGGNEPADEKERNNAPGPPKGGPGQGSVPGQGSGNGNGQGNRR